MFRALVNGVTHQDEGVQKASDMPQFQFTPQDRVYQAGLQVRIEREELKALGLWQRGSKQKADLALEAAFDDDVEKLAVLLREGVTVDSVNAYGNTLLSEAAAGGAEQCVQMLSVQGADPNSLGRYRRTALWRAANAGHAVVVGTLLRFGADPRIYDESAQRPVDVANGEDAKMLLECWDIRVTKNLQKKRRASMAKGEREQIEKEEKQRAELASALHEASSKREVASIELTEKRHVVLSYVQQLRECQDDPSQLQELQTQLERQQVGLKIIAGLHQSLEWEEKKIRLRQRDFEVQLERKRMHANMMKRKESLAANKPHHEEIADGVAFENELSMFDKVIQLQDLSSIVMTDFHGSRADDGRWPMFFDTSGKVRTFFDYSGFAVFDALELRQLQFSQERRERQRLQVALLRQLKFGGGVVIDVGSDLSLMSIVEDAINAIEPSLFGVLTDRAVLYSYLLPQRFLSWPACHLDPEEAFELEFDEKNLSKFLLSFIVSKDSKGDQPVNVIETTETEASPDDEWFLVQGTDAVEELSDFYTVKVCSQ
mmetsp:Transcript_15692/g.28232  ORF Transcript_15692/g.28232 Transcript_15692/m.28232 type:complete len:544 (-) Transcript_15692:112-1743(-)